MAVGFEVFAVEHRQTLRDFGVFLIAILAHKMITEIREQGLKRDTIGHHRTPNAMKQKDRPSLDCAHNPKVGGSNPSPAIS
jgi:hypothetical protein